MKAPSVIIGVGGIGAEICANVAMIPGNASRRNVRFVIMDTDINSIRELHRKGFRGTEILLTDNMTVSRCRESMGGTEDWYPDSDIFNEKPMTEGAGQQRAISRLALEYSIREGKLNPLFDVIQELNELTMEESNQQMRFYIISSLAGGTGSGLILPLALRLKRFVLEESGDNLCICKGFFVLSSALRRSVGTRLEQKSLDSNAYAAIKELYAFMQSADNRRGRYPDLARSLAEEGDCSVASYEYCFLFGMANEKGKRMHSFEELKQMVAQAVNMQAYSPIHDRNSSREDNTIKHITYKMLEEDNNGSLNRFGGIGCGELVYPYEILKEYYALQWALDVMNGAWQAYDQSYYIKQKEQVENRKLGKKTTPVSRGIEYSNSIQFADSHDLFAENIRTSCEHGNIHTEGWKGYLDALAAEVDRQVEVKRQERWQDDTQHDDEFLQVIEHMMVPGSRYKEKVALRNRAVGTFRQLKREILSITAGLQGYHKRFFFEPPFHKQENRPYRMEYWLQKDGDFIHPNAVRYFLYQLLKSLEEKILEMEKRLVSGLSNVNACDGKNEKKLVETLLHNFQQDRDDYERAYEALYQYVKDQVYANVLKKCKEYAEQLAKNYEDFYDSIQEMQDVFLEQRDDLVKELDRIAGISKSYVCADEQCREEVFRNLKKQPEFYRITSGLSFKIYELAHAPSESRSHRKQRFRQMEQYWKDDLENNFRDMLDMNILQAMDREEICKYGRHMSAEEMSDRIDQVRKTLIEPFVQYYKTAGEEQGISICCYNSILLEEHGEYKKAVEWLREHEGVDDDMYCDSRRIMFYRSFVGLDVAKVLEYLHWDRGSGCKGNGKAFRYYEQTLQDMGKAKDGKSQITPHLDKSWHSFLRMPDTDGGYQMNTEIDIAVIFLYGVANSCIQKEESDGKYRVAVNNYQSKPLDTLFKVHEHIYENAQVRKQLYDNLKQKIDSDAMEGSRRMLDKIEEFEGGIYRILLDYNEELSLGKQDEVLNRCLVEAAARLVELFILGDAKDTQGEVLKFLWKEWNKQEPRYSSAQDTNNGKKARLEMIVLLIKLFFQRMNS